MNTLFVLDEPSIGLHPRDMQRVIKVMHRLRDAGNTLVGLEHDPQIMLEADRILDLGPGAGERGGQIVCYGTPAQVSCAHSRSATSSVELAGRRQLAPLRASSIDRTRRDADESIRLFGASEHNLKHVDIEIPLHRLV